MIEAELKATLTDPESVRAMLAAASGEPERAEYADVYLDRADELGADERELRVRTITTSAGERTVLTYKGPVADAASGSKPETETQVQDRDAIRAILTGLGYAPVIELTKRCENYRLSTPAGRPVLATVVTVLEIEGTFIEVETMVEEPDLAEALGDLHALLLNLEIGPDALTTELYTDAVAAARARHSRFVMQPGDIVWEQ